MLKKLSTRLIALLWVLISVGCGLSGKGKEDSFPPPQNYRGIVPGQTTEEEVLSILGQPDEVSVWEPDDARYLDYYDLKVLIILSLQDQVVDWIWISDQVNTLGRIIDRYGEPELIALRDPDKCFPDDYSISTVTSLYYPQLGITATLWDAPSFSRDFVISGLIYFEPMTLQTYLERIEQLTECDKIIEWPGFEQVGFRLTPKPDATARGSRRARCECVAFTELRETQRQFSDDQASFPRRGLF